MRLKKSDVICWYPSPMLDFKSILNWEQAKGNLLQPTVFLFTDNLYSSYIVNNYENAIVQFQKDFDNVDLNIDIINTLIFSNGRRLFKESMACFSFKENKIILIPHEYMTDSNQTFYKYLTKNSISLDCLYAKRTCVDFNYIDTLKTIGIKEAMVGTLTGEEENLMKNDFRYKKVGEPFLAIDSHTNGKDEVQLYKERIWEK